MPIGNRIPITYTLEVTPAGTTLRLGVPRVISRGVAGPQIRTDLEFDCAADALAFLAATMGYNDIDRRAEMVIDEVSDRVLESCYTGRLFQ